MNCKEIICIILFDILWFNSMSFLMIYCLIKRKYEIIPIFGGGTMACNGKVNFV